MRKEITFDRFIRGALVAAAILAVFWFVKELSSVLLPFFIAWFLAYLLYPIVKFVQYKLHVPTRALSIIVTLIFVTAIIGGVTYLFGADGAMQYGWYTDASGMRYFQTNGAMAVNTTLAVGGVTYVFDANGLATAVPVINPATWVTDPATGVTIDTATGAVVPAETVAGAAAAVIAQK